MATAMAMAIVETIKKNRRMLIAELLAEQQWAVIKYDLAWTGIEFFSNVTFDNNHFCNGLEMVW